MIVFTIGMKDVYLGVTNSPNNLRLHLHYCSFVDSKTIPDWAYVLS